MRTERSRGPAVPDVFADVIALAQRIRAGDTAAEDGLVLFFEREVLALLKRRIRDRETARELADDVLMGVVCALRAGRLRDATKIQAFVRGTLRNVANNYLRTRFTHPPEEPLPSEMPALVETADRLEEDDRLAVLEEGLSQLGGPDRQILLMTMVKGLHPRQIAENLGLTPEVVRTRKSRALSRLITSMRRGEVRDSS
jgi:RNA polymerase sigma factor (sigma-70 family)